MKPNKICFIGAFGAGKSHTIRELLGDHAPPEIVVSDKFGSATQHETSVLVPLTSGDYIEVIDTRGLDSEDFDDNEIIAAINWVVDSTTIFVLVLNNAERRMVSIGIASQVIRGRRVLVYDNCRDSTPVSVDWYREQPNAARCKEIARALKKPVGDFPITNKQWAIAPYLRLMLAGVPCSVDRVYFNIVADKLDESNRLRSAAHEKNNADTSSALANLRTLSRMLGAQIQSYEHHCMLFRRYQESKKDSSLCPEGVSSPGTRYEWSLNKYFSAEIQTNSVFSHPTELIRAFAWSILEVARRVSDADISSRGGFSVPVLPPGLRDWAPEPFVPQARICLTFADALFFPYFRSK